jgi:hypothetical protein
MKKTRERWIQGTDLVAGFNMVEEASSSPRPTTVVHTMPVIMDDYTAANAPVEQQTAASLAWEFADGLTTNGDVLASTSDELVGTSSAEAIYETEGEDQSLQWLSSRNDKVLCHNKSCRYTVPDYPPFPQFKGYMLGLSTQQDAEPPVCRETIGYGLGCGSRGGLYVWELGRFKGTFGEYQAGDSLELVVSGNSVAYHHKGKLLYTSTAEAELPLVASACFYTAGASVKGLQINLSERSITLSATKAEREVAAQLAREEAAALEAKQEMEEKVRQEAAQRKAEEEAAALQAQKEADAKAARAAAAQKAKDDALALKAKLEAEERERTEAAEQKTREEEAARKAKQEQQAQYEAVMARARQQADQKAKKYATEVAAAGGASEQAPEQEQEQEQLDIQVQAETPSLSPPAEEPLRKQQVEQHATLPEPGASLPEPATPLVLNGDGGMGMDSMGMGMDGGMGMGMDGGMGMGMDGGMGDYMDGDMGMGMDDDDMGSMGMGDMGDDDLVI